MDKKYTSECLAIVESVLTEEPIDENDFLKKCEIITKSHYNDIITERSLIDLCGYVLCNKRLSVHNSKLKPSQKYHISLNYNRVYEISERKMFCSNLCFKSSNYLREQISEEPLWMRKDSKLKKNNSIHLYNEKVGQLGDEVVFNEHIINESNFETIDNDIEEEKHVSKQKSVSINKCKDKKMINNKNIIGFPYIREEYLNELKTQMKGLTINERLDERLNTIEVNQQKCSPESNTDSTEHKNTDKKSEQTISWKLSLECIENRLKEWITPSTHEFVFGTKIPSNQENCQQIDESIDELITEEENEKKLEQMNYTYFMLCSKLDLEEKKDQLIDDILLGRKTNGKSAKEYADEDLMPVYSDDFNEKFEAFKKGKMALIRNRKVRFNESVNSNESKDKPCIPLTASQDIIHERQQIFLSNIDKVLIDLFDTKYLEELRINIKRIVYTLEFRANNVVVLQTQESVLMTLFLIRILILSKKLEHLDHLFDNVSILSVLNSYHLNKSEMDEKILSYFQN